MKETDQFNFAEWSPARKALRMSELMESAQIKHSPERKQQIIREMTHLAFEMELPLDF